MNGLNLSETMCIKMNSGLFKNVISKTCLEFLYFIYV